MRCVQWGLASMYQLLWRMDCPWRSRTNRHPRIARHPARSCANAADANGWGSPTRKQLARKQLAMSDLYRPLIERFGWRVDVDPVLGIGPSRETGPVTVADAPLPAPRSFRHKAATPFAPGACGEVRSGFFARGTHDIVPCPACAVEAPGRVNSWATSRVSQPNSTSPLTTRTSAAASFVTPCSVADGARRRRCSPLSLARARCRTSRSLSNSSPKPIPNW